MEPQKPDHWSQYFPGKLRRGGGQANLKARELVHLTVYHELEVFSYRPCHGNMKISVLYVHQHSPLVLFDGRPGWSLGLHLEPWNDQMVLQVGEIYYTRKRQQKKPLVSCLITDFIAPLDKSISTAIWKSSGVFLVVKEMGFRVSRGCDSHSSWTPFPTVCDARQSPSSLCRCGAKAARKAPTRSISMTAGRGSSSSNTYIPAAMSSVTSASSSFHSLLLRLSSLLLLLAPASHGGLTEGLLITSVSQTGLVVEWTPMVPDRAWLASAGSCRNVKISRPATMQNLLFLQPHNFRVTPLVPDP